MFGGLWRPSARICGGILWQWRELLKAIYATQRDIPAYVEVCTASELTPADCDVIARLHQEQQACEEALAWVERGLQLDTGRYSGAHFDLRRRKHALLVSLGSSRDTREKRT